MEQNSGPPSISTLAQLKEINYEPKSVKQEIKFNAIKRIENGLPIIEGLVGYEDSVLPDLTNAILAEHDIILLGERGQGKTKIIRSLVNLLDEWIPVLKDSEINESPFSPILKRSKAMVAKFGDDTEIGWLHRSSRYTEKLATPDTTVADLIGEVDPIKVAEGRYLSDIESINFALIPRANRGIFAINELPDLQERIQVALFNVLEERDIQLRGINFQIPLDIFLIASANPEDYTSRGRIVTPLKDRFGTQIRTHYASDPEVEREIIKLNSSFKAPDGFDLTVPDFIEEIVANFSIIARLSSKINQSSGVSARISISNYEAVLANSVRRALALRENKISPRICDFRAIEPTSSGKLEIDAFDESDPKEIIKEILNSAILTAFNDRFKPAELSGVIGAFETGAVVNVGEDVGSKEYSIVLESIPSLEPVLKRLVPSPPSEAEIASAIEFVLEGLHLSNRINKDVAANKTIFRKKSSRGPLRPPDSLTGPG